jgi:hypothetical protein
MVKRKVWFAAKLWLLSGLITALAPVGCQRSPTPQGGQAAPAELPADFFLAAEPPGALDVRAAKSAADKELVVRGRIGGRRNPFVAGAAIFLITDKPLPMCSDRHGDSCPTPWDSCCEPPELVRAATATVQVLAPDGRPLATSLRGRNGLEPGAEVVVVGTRAEQDQGGLVISARAIYVAKP